MSTDEQDYQRFINAINDMVKDFRKYPHDDAEQIINDLEAWLDDYLT